MSSLILDTMMIYDDLTILMYRDIIKNNNNPSAFKSVTTAPKIGTSSPIPDTMVIYDDLTILMYRNIIKNNNNPSAFKSVTTAPKIGTSSPIPDTIVIYDDLNILMYRNIIKNNNKQHLGANKQHSGLIWVIYSRTLGSGLGTFLYPCTEVVEEEVKRKRKGLED